MTAGPFEAHLREAIALNRERSPRYAELSSGRSRAISRALIGAELLLLPIARWFDRKGEPYARAGIPLIDSLFVPMAGAPAFLPFRQADVDAARYQPPRPGQIRKRVATAHRAGGFPDAARALARELDALGDTPQVDCLVRHLLESALRIATVAPGHVATSRARGLRSPASLLAALLHMHLWGLPAAAVMDRRARPLQLRGIAILAQDLPAIPPDVTEGAADSLHAVEG